MRLVIVMMMIVLLAAPAFAETVGVEVYGEVEYNQVNFGDFADVNPGDPVLIVFNVDSDDFMNSASFPTRGYVIDQSTFSLTMGSVTEGLQNPFPAGQTPYFVLRDNDPAVDGFFLSTNVDFPGGLPLNEPANLDPYFNIQSMITYTGETLSSLDILDALGTYDFDGLTNFWFVVLDGPFEPIGMVFDHMIISSGSVPTENQSWGGVKALYQ